jgi:flagellar biosynthesis protein FlhB
MVVIGWPPLARNAYKAVEVVEYINQIKYNMRWYLVVFVDVDANSGSDITVQLYN